MSAWAVKNSPSSTITESSEKYVPKNYVENEIPVPDVPWHWMCREIKFAWGIQSKWQRDHIKARVSATIKRMSVETPYSINLF